MNQRKNETEEQRKNNFRIFFRNYVSQMINDIFKVLKETVNLDSIFRINIFQK